MENETIARSVREQVAALAVADEARHVLMKLDDARKREAERDDREVVKQIDFAIGVTFSLRKAVQDYDKTVGREPSV